MQLKSLEIKGFKSFANKTVFEFDAPISAIVGPNGSGKSNAVEAFRFVLGEQSMKSMRSKKGEDLLFNGSRSVSRANRASVKVTLDNSDRLLDIDFDEVTIERVVHRDASNEYILNGSQVRLKDITELLAEANIGISGHHIISQGEADKVLNINTRERKTMIEDALGLKVYHYKIDKAEKKLNKTEQNLKEIKSLRRELKPRLKYLEKQVKKLKKARELSKTLTEKYKEYFKREAVYIEYEKKRIKEEMEQPKSKLEHLISEKKEAQEVLDAQEERREDPRKEKLTALQEKLEEIRDQKDMLSRKIGRVEGGISSEERNLKREEKREQSSSDNIPLDTVRSLFNAMNNTIQAALSGDSADEMRRTLREIKRQFNSFLEDHSNEVSEEDGAAVISSIKENIDNLKEKRNTIQSELADIKEKENDIFEKYQVLESKIKSDQQEHQKAEKRLLELKAKESNIRSQLNTLEGKRDLLEEVESEFKSELGEAGTILGKEATKYADIVVENENGEKISPDQIVSEDRSKQKKRRKEIEKMKAQLENARRDTSRGVQSEYEEVKERDVFLANEIEDLSSSKERLSELIEELEGTLEHKFKDGIEEINKKFEHFFSLMFGGGEATLKITKENVRGGDDDEDEYEHGVDIDVNLPYKRIKGLEMLSGGERALTSIALLFSVTQINPPPFIVLDETDAALDEANSRKYGDMIEELSEESQLVLITHNRETMSRADVLYGITMGGDGVSKLLSIEFEEAVKVAK